MNKAIAFRFRTRSGNTRSRFSGCVGILQTELALLDGERLGYQNLLVLRQGDDQMNSW